MISWEIVLLYNFISFVQIDCSFRGITVFEINFMTAVKKMCWEGGGGGGWHTTIGLATKWGPAEKYGKHYDWRRQLKYNGHNKAVHSSLPSIRKKREYGRVYWVTVNWREIAVEGGAAGRASLPQESRASKYTPAATDRMLIEWPART